MAQGISSGVGERSEGRAFGVGADGLAGIVRRTVGELADAVERALLIARHERKDGRLADDEIAIGGETLHLTKMLKPAGSLPLTVARGARLSDGGDVLAIERSRPEIPKLLLLATSSHVPPESMFEGVA